MRAQDQFITTIRHRLVSRETREPHAARQRGHILPVKDKRGVTGPGAASGRTREVPERPVGNKSGKYKRQARYLSGSKVTLVLDADRLVPRQKEVPTGVVPERTAWIPHKKLP